MIKGTLAFRYFKLIIIFENDYIWSIILPINNTIHNLPQKPCIYIRFHWETPGEYRFLFVYYIKPTNIKNTL